MAEELLINVSPMESRVAVLSDGVPSEIYVERANKVGLVGNIYLGTVVRVLPGMQAAFIDIGQSRTAFLHVNDMQTMATHSQANHLKAMPSVSTSPAANSSSTSISSESSTKPFSRRQQPSPTLLTSIDIKHANGDFSTLNAGHHTTPDTEQSLDNTAAEKPHTTSINSKTFAARELIQNRLQEGQKLLVQVTKDQFGSKGARLTTSISLPSRLLVYLPAGDHIGISQRIEDPKQRERLKTELTTLMQAADLPGGLIVRTAAEWASIDKIEQDIHYLMQLWRTVQTRKRNALYHTQVATSIYQELTLPLRAIRDLMQSSTDRVIIDDLQTYQAACQFAEAFMSFVAQRIVLHNKKQPLFDVYGVEEHIKQALNRRVDLPSGGHLIIDQTEAMTTIDVNTGSYVGSRCLEDTVYKTNLEATHAIARQLKLRNLGGIIILDFIDMDEPKHRMDVLNTLQVQLSQDYAKTKITQVSELGLVEMTRKRTRESLEQLLCEPCQACQGRGVVKTAQTVCFDILREIMRHARYDDSSKKITVVAHADIVDLLLTSEANTVADLQALTKKTITFKAESWYHREQYDVIVG